MRSFRPFFSHLATMMNLPIFLKLLRQQEKSQKYFDLLAFNWNLNHSNLCCNLDAMNFQSGNFFWLTRCKLKLHPKSFELSQYSLRVFGSFENSLTFLCITIDVLDPTFFMFPVSSSWIVVILSGVDSFQVYHI